LLLRPVNAESLLIQGIPWNFNPQGFFLPGLPFIFKGVKTMPGKKHLKGVGEKEQRQYEHILESARKEGRYPGRAKEVAARTVMKEHRRKGHRKGN
jgi:hypothetical protein